MRRFHTSVDDRGVASTMFLVGLTLALLAMMMLFFRLGDAHLLRSNAQTAADAAALAAAAEVKNSLAQNLAGSPPGITASYSGVEDSAEAAAEKYARANSAVLSDIRSSDDNHGFRGNIIRVEVRGAQCRQELEADRSVDWADYSCPEDEPDTGVRDVGNAAAIAEVVWPDCQYQFDPGNTVLVCNGQAIRGDLAVARGVVEVRLADTEGRYLHTGEEPDSTIPDEPDDPPEDPEDEEEEEPEDA